VGEADFGDGGEFFRGEDGAVDAEAQAGAVHAALAADADAALHVALERQFVRDVT